MTSIPTSPVKKKKPLISDENTIVLSDIHVPYHDKPMLELALACAETSKVKNFIIAGDFLSLDAFYDGGVVESVMAELDLARKIVEHIDDSFNSPKIYWIMGNHEYRLVRQTEKQLGIDALAKIIEGGADLEVSDLAWMRIKGWGIVAHPGNYSKIPLSVPLELAEINRSNIITAHTHHVGQAYSKSGYAAIESGVLCDQERAAYKQRLMKRMPQWGKGFVITKKDMTTNKVFATLFTPDKPCIKIAQAIA